MTLKIMDWIVFAMMRVERPRRNSPLQPSWATTRRAASLYEICEDAVCLSVLGDRWWGGG